ncbi:MULTISPECIES: helix-turn-helix domain-containing protein [unclassified Pseudoalteromonas]|uniref:helix-turn-helix domain-containing protein n=1 Tax=unclassified Pseudoalteromonas TaxID=194690 RepID=UPI000CF73A20|nr:MULTISPECIES: helix-turn-helix transcriptional regulator [unclassified Pseudoalteromonas]
MNLKQLRLSRQLSQEQLAQMSGLNVRTVQRIESGANASLESQKCLAAALDVDLATLNQEKVMIDKSSDNWKNLPLFLKLWFVFHFLQPRPTRSSAQNVERLCHLCGYLFCLMGIVNEAALVGGLLMLSTGYLFTLLKYQGDKYQIWYERSDKAHAEG